MNIVMMTDLEGVSGVVSFDLQTRPDTRYYEESRKLLMGEVNAAVEGMMESDVDDVLVVDGHGPGGINFDYLHPAAKLMHGRPNPPRSFKAQYIKHYDAAVMIGQHAMAGTVQGTLNHTQNSRAVDYYKLNGKYIGEIAQCALWHGALGIPLIFLSGDEAACKEAEDLIPGIVTTAVKTGLGRQSAISLSKEEARKRIKAGIGEAVKRHRENPIKPLVWEGPFTLEKRYFTSMNADDAMKDPRYKRIDSQTISITLDNIFDIIYA
jgi:D-amino peptidase